MQQPGVRRRVELILYTKSLNGRDQPGSCARSGLVNLRPAIDARGYRMASFQDFSDTLYCRFQICVTAKCRATITARTSTSVDFNTAEVDVRAPS
jgi:hypothetical protein